VCDHLGQGKYQRSVAQLSSLRRQAGTAGQGIVDLGVPINAGDLRLMSRPLEKPPQRTRASTDFFFRTRLHNNPYPVWSRANGIPIIIRGLKGITVPWFVFTRQFCMSLASL